MSKYAADVDVESIEAEDEWALYLSLVDAHKLDDERKAFRRDDLKVTSQITRIFILQPIAILRLW